MEPPCWLAGARAFIRRARPQTQRETRNKAHNVKPRLDTKPLALYPYKAPALLQAKRKRKERLETKLIT
jgi:hypothetical protein